MSHDDKNVVCLKEGFDWIPSALNEVIKRQNKRLSFLENYNPMDQDEKIRIIKLKEQMDKEEEIHLKQELGQLQEIAESLHLPAGSSTRPSISKQQSVMNYQGLTPADYEKSGGSPDQLIKTPDFICVFVAQQTLSQCSKNKPSSVVQFKKAVLNIGGAFNSKESVFIAPKSGIYEFNFDGHKTATEYSLYISLRINGKQSSNAWSHFIGYDPDLGYSHTFANIISTHALLKLNKGDRIDIYNKKGNLGGCQEDKAVQPTQFTGKFLLEDAYINSRIDDSNTLNIGKNSKLRFPVYFNVQKNASYCNPRSSVRFEIVNINVGRAFDMEHQEFVSPLAGIYEFTVKGLKTGKQEVTEVSLRLNGIPVAFTYADFASPHDYHAPFSMNSILKLEKGDRIDFLLKKGCLYDDTNRYTQFTGKLLVEYESISTNPSLSSDDAAYFYVQKNAPFSTANAVIPFEVVVLNIGGVFDESNHFFTAPRSGIYEFNAAGFKGANINKILCIALRLNSKSVTHVWADWLGYHTLFTPHFSLHYILKVKKGDRIDLFNVGEGSTLHDDFRKITHFSGKLLFADDNIA